VLGSNPRAQTKGRLDLSLQSNPKNGYETMAVRKDEQMDG